MGAVRLTLINNSNKGFKLQFQRMGPQPRVALQIIAIRTMHHQESLLDNMLIVFPPMMNHPFKNNQWTQPMAQLRLTKAPAMMPQ